MFGPETPVMFYFRQAYVPENLPGELHAKTRAGYEIDLGKLNTFFRWWLRSQQLPEREILLGDLNDGLLKLAMQWWMEPEPIEGIHRANVADTANKLFRHAKAVWNLAWAKDILPKPCRTKPYKVVKRKARIWSPEQVRLIVKTSLLMPGYVGPIPAGKWWLAHILTSLSIGVRISAQMRIPPRFLDLDRGEVFVYGESQKQRADQAFDLLPSAVLALRELKVHERGLPTVFGDWPFDGDGSYRALRRHLKKLFVRAGLFKTVKEIGRRELFHKFRKNVLTEIAAKKGILEAQRFAGHSAVSVTEGYIDDLYMPDRSMADVLTDPLAEQMTLFDPPPTSGPSQSPPAAPLLRLFEPGLQTA